MIIVTRALRAYQCILDGSDNHVFQVPVVLNSFDDEGNVVDSTTQDLTVNQISDIVDHAAQYVLLDGNIGDDLAGTEEEAARRCLDELENALTVANVISE